MANSATMIEKQPLSRFTESAYLDYSMYVILDRALPHISDGLKPVQRRIVYAMSELGLNAKAKHKKSARTIGDVIGKFHPHGDSACYEAMVLMAQDFSYRYPLVDGQGNFGSPDDPKSFAAMRYTESKLSPYATILLSELEQGTTDWVQNFDGTLDEPRLLPARLPNVLLNGSTGIAVGMATDIPPHNLREVVRACEALLDNSKLTVEDLCQYIPAPDFPTHGEIITPKKELIEMYKTGHGSLRMRGVYKREDGDIVIHALPHMVSGSKVIEQIAQLMQAKKLPLVADVRDESDHENPTRIVIIPRSNRVDVDELMSHLFATTDLEKTYKVNLNMIGLNGKPKVRNLKEILTEWLEYRIETVRRRLSYRLDKVKSRLHILDGLLIAFLNLDEVIRIIREEDNPKAVLMKRFKLSDLQSEAILDLKLRHLARLEEIQIQSEQKELNEEREKLEKTLSSEQRLKTVVKKELSEDAKTYGDDRRSPLVTRSEARVMIDLERPAVELITVILSEKGWVRVAKGHGIDPESLSYKTGDSFKSAVQGRSDQPIIFMDSTGRSYTVSAQDLPSARGQGEPITSKINPPTGATFEAMFMADQGDCVLISSAGYGFKVPMSELVSKNRSGKAIMKLKPDQKLFAGLTLLDKVNLSFLTEEGKLLVIPLQDVPELTKGKGNKLIALGKNDKLIGCVALSKQGSLELKAGARKISLFPKDLKPYTKSTGDRAEKLPKGSGRAQGMTAIDP